jgi:hypothetical protein
LWQEVAIKDIDKSANDMVYTTREIAAMLRIQNPHCVKLFVVRA